MSKVEMSKSPVTPELGASESKAGEAASKYVPEGGDGEEERERNKLALELRNKLALELLSSPAPTPRTPGHEGGLSNFTPDRKIQSRGVSKVHPAGAAKKQKDTCCVIS